MKSYSCQVEMEQLIFSLFFLNKLGEGGCGFLVLSGILSHSSLTLIIYFFKVGEKKKKTLWNWNIFPTFKDEQPPIWRAAKLWRQTPGDVCSIPCNTHDNVISPGWSIDYNWHFLQLFFLFWLKSRKLLSDPDFYALTFFFFNSGKEMDE